MRMNGSSDLQISPYPYPSHRPIVFIMHSVEHFNYPIPSHKLTLTI